ncbi:MAG TPA: hypothetical protein VFG69_19405, partial [Nannocystaceae bacterium]|nr:hypothetical protein [Nannocystaceae bacterium]
FGVFGTSLLAMRLLSVVAGLVAAALVYAIGRAGDFVATARFSGRQFVPVGPIALLSTPLPASLVIALVVLTVALGVAFVLGWRFRGTGPAFAAALLCLTSYRNSWSMVFHTENLMVLHVIVLAGSRAADAWALDARGRPLPEPHWRYGWPIELLCRITVATYLIAGITKLRNGGIGWVTSDTLRNFVAYDNLRKAELGDLYSPIGAFMVRYDWLFPPLAAAALLVELGAPLALLHRRVAIAWCGLSWAFHVGVLAVMWIVFHYPLLGLAYAPFFALDRVLVRVPWFAAGATAPGSAARDTG